MKNMYNSLDLAKYIVSKCIKDKFPVTNIQLNKILWSIQKDFFTRGEMAFPDDIEIWKFGPVIPNVYYHYCGYGAEPICLEDSSEPLIILSQEHKNRIDAIIDEKRQLAPWDWVKELSKDICNDE